MTTTETIIEHREFRFTKGRNAGKKVTFALVRTVTTDWRAFQPELMQLFPPDQDGGQIFQRTPEEVEDLRPMLEFMIDAMQLAPPDRDRIKAILAMSTMTPAGRG